MTKKTRRVRRKGVKPRLSEAQLMQPTQKAVQETAPEVKVAAVETVQQQPETDFREEYHYVVSDLQRIGLLAAAMLGGLLILSFVL
jgi:hypothetical protein